MATSPGYPTYGVDMKKPIILSFVLLLFIVSYTHANENSQFPAGIVYGPKAAFQINAPKGWVLDNKAGLNQGLHCVLYIAGETWANRPAVMYANIASPEYPDKEVFIKFAIDSFKKDDNAFIFRKIQDGSTKEGFIYTINEYFRPNHSHYERVAYLQMPGAVAYIVYSAFSEKDYHKYVSSLNDVLNTFKNMPRYINYKE